MPSPSSLPPGKLRVFTAPDSVGGENLDFLTLDRIGKNSSRVFHPRAARAIELASSARSDGYNIFLSAENGLDAEKLAIDWLSPLAEDKPVPADLLYVYNFADPSSPSLLSMPAGQGREFRDALRSALSSLRDSFRRALDEERYARRKSDILKKFNSQKAEAFRSAQKFALKNGFILELDEDGDPAIGPAKGASAKGLKRSVRETPEEILGDEIFNYLQETRALNDAFSREEERLHKDAMEETLTRVLDPLASRFLKSAPSENLKKYLADLRRDFLHNADVFAHLDEACDDDLDRLKELETRGAINLFVDNASLKGAPVIFEDNPSFANLLGCMERESEMGALVTDLGLIRAGSLHRANGGFLILRADSLRPAVWEALARALRRKTSVIEDNEEITEISVRVRSPRPQAIPLDLKVILIGDEDIYEFLQEHDQLFGRLFKIKAHLEERIERTSANIKLYASQIVKMIREEGLSPFSPRAIARLVDEGSFICEDQKKLSLKFLPLKDLMIEASALANKKGLAIVDDKEVEEAREEKIFRSNLLQETLMEDYERELIEMPTNGSAIGQINGLSLIYAGDYEFGLPQKISCAVGAGHDGVIDLEREADLGGPIHTKAMMILKSYLTNLFARKKPLALTASIYFEQSYGEIEGDSASGAELAALLSALAEVPIRLDLAFTGAVGHSGRILAVGGVTGKIEGFYSLCSRRGLTGTQGVVIPAANIDHLMLPREIIKSVEKGEFHIYPVKTIEEALFILTGIPAGRRRKDGSFTPRGIFDLVDRRLENLGFAAQNAFRRQRKE